MKIQKLELQNFRYFEHKEFNFPNQFTVIIGDNGTGKTAIVDALAIGINCFFSQFAQIQMHHGNFPLNQNDVRLILSIIDQVKTIKYIYPCHILCRGVVNNTGLEWVTELKQEKTSYMSSNIGEFLLNLIEEKSILPLLAYYRNSRLWGQIEKNKQAQKLPDSLRLLGYENWFELTLSQKELLKWFQNQTKNTGDRKVNDILNNVQSSITGCIENCQQINYDANTDQLIATFKDGRNLPLEMLSDGFRTMLVMVADIAYRAAVLNPQLGKEAAQKTPGIVLIDEIDLHLHPLWQRRVVEDLKRTFPQIQFIATTHSPFIIQSLRPDELINLDNRDGEYYNKSIEDIAEDVMGVELPQQSERWKKMMQAAEKYYQVLEQAKNASEAEIEKLKEKLDELSMPYSDDPAYQGFLKMERLARGL